MQPDDDVRAQYAAIKERFRDTSADAFASGGWLADYVKHVLQERAAKDDRFFRDAYPGTSAAERATKVIRLAARRSAIAGSLSAAAITAAEAGLLLGGLFELPLVPPTIIGAVLADIIYSTTLQLRATYDLSVVHGAPLSASDVEDCYLVLMSALGLSIGEVRGDLTGAGKNQVVRQQASRVVEQQSKRLLKALVKRTAGKQVARRATERTLLRVLAPGVNIPLSAVMNWRFTMQVLAVADTAMRRRAAILRPLLRVFEDAPAYPRELVLRALAAVVEAPGEGWSAAQKDALRNSENALSLLGGDDLFERFKPGSPLATAEVVAALPPLGGVAAGALVDYLACVAALGGSERFDDAHAALLGDVARRLGATFHRGSLAAVRLRVAEA